MLTIPFLHTFVGAGIIEKTTPLFCWDAVTEGSDVLLVVEASADDVVEASADDVVEASADDVVEASADDVGVLPIALREESKALASAGETVVVEGLPSLLPLTTLLLFRMSEESESGCALMKAISGPATTALLWRSTTPPFSGWSSDVIQTATGPLIPCGTTHWLIGRERENGMPPMSIWQWKPCECAARCVRRVISAIGTGLCLHRGCRRRQTN